MNSAISTLSASWKKRLRALHHVPALLKIVWRAGPSVICLLLASRLVAALIPVAVLGVSKSILDALQIHLSGHPLKPHFWGLVGAECSLAALGAISSRTIGFFDSLLADRFTRQVSLLVMEHASRLDLSAYEDHAFQNKLNRARLEATNRVAMIQALGTVGQQLVSAATMALSIFWFSPLLLLVLIVTVVPAFLGESHFAFIGYSQNVKQTPVRRKMDYLTDLGSSKESAKELRLFGLNSFLSKQFADLSLGIYEQNAQLARRRLRAGVALSLLSTLTARGESRDGAAKVVESIKHL